MMNPAARMTPARREALAASRAASRASLIARLEATIQEHETAGREERAALYREMLDEARAR